MAEGSQRGEGRRGCLKGCAIGCAVVALLGLAATIGGPMLMMRPLRQAVEARQELERRFGEQDSFTPAPDGTIPADRIEAFLAVRGQLAGICSDLMASSAQMKSLERFDDQEEVSSSEVMREAFKTMRSALGVAPAIAEMFRARNRALLEAEMGLGEYTYIYVTAYHDLLGMENEHEDFLGGEAISSRVNNALTEMARHQLDALDETQPDHPMISLLELEIEALERDSGRALWQDSLPELISLSLEPFRARLDESFCPATTGIDLSINESHGVMIETQ